MVRRSPQKKKAKAAGSRMDPDAPKVVGTVSNEANEDATAVNWLSSSGAAPSLAPDSEPWTPTSRKPEWNAARSPIRSPTKPLEQQVSSLQAQREAADADLWNARIELQDHLQQKEADQERISKLNTELSKLRLEYEHNSQALDELRSHEEELQAHLERERTKAARDRQTVREQLEDRDGFIESLQAQLDELREELKATTQAAALLRRQGDDASLGDISSAAGDITSITVDSDVNLGPSEPSDVAQTLGASELLSQAHQARQQRGLRAALQKQRLENFQLKQQIAELKGAPTLQWKGENEELGDDRSFSEETSHAASSASADFFGGAFSEIPEIPTGVPLSEDFAYEAHNGRDAGRANIATSSEKSAPDLVNEPSGDANLDALTNQLRKKYDAHAAPSDELEVLQNPGIDYLQHHANAVNHKLVPIREYEEMRNTQATRAKLQLTDRELKLAYELLRGRRKSKSRVHSHVLQDLARHQALGLAPDVTHHYAEPSRDPGLSPSRTGLHHRTTSHSSSISDPESAYGDAQSLEGVGSALQQIAQNHGFELVSDTVAGSRELAQRHGLVTVPVESLAVLANKEIISGVSAPISQQVNDVVLSLSKEDADHIRQLLSTAPPNYSREELAELKRRAYTPTSADLAEQAASLGMTVLPLEAVAEMKGQLLQREVPDASTVAALAEKAGLRVIPQHPTLEELREYAPEDAVLVERETWEALERPEPATLRRLAKVHGLAVLPEKEIEGLQESKYADAKPAGAPSSPPSADNLSVDQLREAAQAHDLVLLSADDYRDVLLNRQMRDFSHLPMAARTEHFEKLIRSSQEARTSATSPRGSPSASSLGSLSDRITRLGFVPVAQEEYQRLLASQKVYEPTKSDILRSAKQFGLAVMPLEDALRLRNLHRNSPSKSPRDSSTSTASVGSPSRASSPLKADMHVYNDDDELEGFKAVPTEYLAALRRIVEHPTPADAESIARKVGLTVGRGELSDEDFLQRAKDRGLKSQPTEDELYEFAKSKGFAETLSAEQLIARGKELGLVEPLSNDQVREQAKKISLSDIMSDDEVLARAKQLGLVEPLSDDDILKRARDLGFILSEKQLLDKAKSQGLIEPMSNEEIVVTAKSLGLDKRLTDAEILERARTLGLAEPLGDANILAEARRLGLVDPPSDDDIRESAKLLGLVKPLADAEIKEKAKMLGLTEPLSDEETIGKAKRLGLTEPLADDEIVKRAKFLGLDEPMSDARTVEKAKQLGLVYPLSDDEVLKKAKVLGLSEPLTDTKILERAKMLGLEEPLSAARILEKAKQLGLVDPLSDDAVVERAKSLGLKEPLSEKEVREEAQKLGLVEPLDDIDVLNRAKTLGLVEPPSDANILARASTLGLVKPPTDAYIREKAGHLGLIKAPSNYEVIEKAKSLGLVEPLSDADILIRAETLGLVAPPTDEDITKIAEERGLQPELSDSEILVRAKKLGLVDPLSDSQIVEKAMSLGLSKPLNDTEIVEKAKSLGLHEPYTAERIIEEGKALGLVEPLSDDALINRAKAIGLVDPPTEFEVREKAKAFGLAEPLDEESVRERAKTLGLVSPPTDPEIRARAKSLGLSEPISDFELSEIAKTRLGLIQPLSDAEIVAKAQDLGLSFPLSEKNILEVAKSKGLVEPYTQSKIRDMAKKLGMIDSLDEAEFLKTATDKGFVKDFDERQIRDAADKLGLKGPPHHNERLSAAASSGLIAPYTEDEIRKEAQKLGLVEPPSGSEMIEAAKSNGLVEPYSDARIIEEAKKLGLLLPSEVRKHGGVGERTELHHKNEQTEEADEMLGPVDTGVAAEESSVPQHQERGGLSGGRENEPALTQSELVSEGESNSWPANIRARADLASRSEPKAGELDQINSSPKNTSSTTKNALAADQNVQSAVNGNDCDTIDRDFEPARIHTAQTSEVPTHAAAAAIGPRGSQRLHQKDGSLASTVNRRPVMSSSTATSRANPPPIPERIRKDRGTFPSLKGPDGLASPALRAPPTSIGSDVSEGSRGDPSVIYGPDGPGKATSSGLPQRLGGSPMRRTVRNHELLETPRSLKKGMTRSNTGTSLHGHLGSRATRGSQSSNRALEALNLPMPESSSFRRHGGHPLDSGSVAESIGSSFAAETITGETAELNTSQLIVGEVLYKYTSGFNFEGITGGRHKRYFWFRPESMTLYWHRENPHFLASLYGPAKCVTVIGIEEIPDRNPLPAGLFHRSILIRGRERNLRLTCSTGARHQVWVSTLRYILSEKK